jgi:hypothetical protein
MRELIVVAAADAGLQVTGDSQAAAENADVDALSKILAAEDVNMRPLFGLSEERMRDSAAVASDASGKDVPDLGVYYHVDAPEESLDKLAEKLAKLDVVEAAYVKPPGEPPVVQEVEEQKTLNDMAPALEEAPPITADFSGRQAYLDAAPAGIDARYAWTLAGGRGAGVKIIDCEWGWRFGHEDLLVNQGGIVGGSGSTDDNHGTAVLGEYSGDHNGYGVLGICPEATASAVAFSMPSATAIRMAADKLGPGDIILLEIHRPGPNATGAGQFGYIAIEWWPDDFAAIRYAVAKGIVVVEAAGNGQQDLDAAVYNTKPSGFPASWRNPFNPANPSSEAVVVGAGNPPPGTHGRTVNPGWGETYVDRARCGFSNYGSRVDCQGWGFEVTTAGYGDLQGGSNRDLWYTDTFSGTSSASPIVVGALGCIQGVRKAQGSPPLNSAGAIGLLRSTGSPQQAAAGRPASQRIGNRPDLRQAISAATKVWYSARAVQMTFCSRDSQNAWALIEGVGWRRCAAGSPDAVTNMFIACVEARANSKRVNVEADGSSIYQVYLV